jgi:hypothetical protein
MQSRSMPKPGRGYSVPVCLAIASFCLTVCGTLSSIVTWEEATFGVVTATRFQPFKLTQCVGRVCAGVSLPPPQPTAATRQYVLFSDGAVRAAQGLGAASAVLSAVSAGLAGTFALRGHFRILAPAVYALLTLATVAETAVVVGGIASEYAGATWGASPFCFLAATFCNVLAMVMYCRLRPPYTAAEQQASMAALRLRQEAVQTALLQRLTAPAESCQADGGPPGLDWAGGSDTSSEAA